MQNDFVKVYDFMIRDYNLSGNKLLIYAIIFSYTENRMAVYAHQENIGKRIGISRQTANRCINQLKDMGLIDEIKCEMGRAYVSKKRTADVAKCDSSCQKMRQQSVKKRDSKVSKNATADFAKRDRPLYTKRDKKYDKQFDSNSAPSFSIEKYNAFVDNFELKYKSH